MIKAQGKVKQRSDFKAWLYFHIVIRTLLVTMKGGITLVLVLFASITIGDVDAIQCYKCDGKSRDKMLNNVCQGDDLGNLVECTGYCEKKTTAKTGGFSGLACMAFEFQLIPNSSTTFREDKIRGFSMVSKR